CARVFTAESVDFSGDNSCFFGLLSSPARIARVGVLVMDVTTIDPGFRGELSFTLINFGAHPFVVERGMTIATVTVGRLDERVEQPLMARSGKQPYDGRFKAISYLAPDLLGLTHKAESAAKQSAMEVVEKLKSEYWRNFGYPALVSATAAGFTVILGFIAFFQENSIDFFFHEQKVRELELRIEKLEGQVRDLPP
ncbi:MAG: hypothetical protein AAFQ16_11705, partial [Pseudomonadota bacterium]